jgi:hypothetical protein
VDADVRATLTAQLNTLLEDEYGVVANAPADQRKRALQLILRQRHGVRILVQIVRELTPEQLAEVTLVFMGFQEPSSGPE